MTDSRIDFIDELTDQHLTVFVQSARVTDSDENDLSQSVFFAMETFNGAVGGTAYIPRKKAKKIIKAMKKVLADTQ